MARYPLVGRTVDQTHAEMRQVLADERTAAQERLTTARATALAKSVPTVDDYEAWNTARILLDAIDDAIFYLDQQQGTHAA